MRAYDLALFLALFGAVMGILDSSAVWTSGTINTGPEVINQTVFSEITPIEDPSAVEILTQTVTYSWTALLLLFNVLMRIVWIQDIIVDTFGGSSEVITAAYAVQVGIWLTYAVALFQMKTGKSVKGME